MTVSGFTIDKDAKAETHGFRTFCRRAAKKPGIPRFLVRYRSEMNGKALSGNLVNDLRKMPM